MLLGIEDTLLRAVHGNGSPDVKREIIMGLLSRGARTDIKDDDGLSLIDILRKGEWDAEFESEEKVVRFDQGSWGGVPLSG